MASVPGPETWASPHPGRQCPQNLALPDTRDQNPTVGYPPVQLRQGDPGKTLDTSSPADPASFPQHAWRMKGIGYGLTYPESPAPLQGGTGRRGPGPPAGSHACVGLGLPTSQGSQVPGCLGSAASPSPTHLPTCPPGGPQLTPTLQVRPLHLDAPLSHRTQTSISLSITD